MATCLRSDLFPESLKGLLRQKYEPLEIIVLVDGNEPESIEILKKCGDPRVRWITTPKPSGMVPAWNRVVREAKGKYALFCADDDVLLDGAIDEQVTLLEENDRVGFCHGDFIFIDDAGQELNRWVSHRGRFIDRGLESWPDYLVSPRCCMQSTVFRVDLWKQVKGWDEDAGNPGDNSLYLKLLRISDVGHVAKIVCLYRIRTSKPDSWQKRFSNLRDNQALAEKHLRFLPEGLGVSASVLSRRLSARYASYGVALAGDPPSPADALALRGWLRKNAWTGSAFGALCRVADVFGATGILAQAMRLDTGARRVARTWVGKARMITSDPPT